MTDMESVTQGSRRVADETQHEHSLLLDVHAKSWYKRNGHDLKTQSLNLRTHLRQVLQEHLQHVGIAGTHTADAPGFWPLWGLPPQEARWNPINHEAALSSSSGSFCSPPVYVFTSGEGRWGTLQSPWPGGGAQWAHSQEKPLEKKKSRRDQF